MSDVPDMPYCPELQHFTMASAQFLQHYSFRTKLAYVEIEYSEGIRTQAGVLYENGQIHIAPHTGEGTINILLRELGVWCVPGKDEFDSLNLGIYRRMTKWIQ